MLCGRLFELPLNSHFLSSCRQGSDIVQSGPFPVLGINPDRSGPLLVVLFFLPGGLFKVGYNFFGTSDQ